MKRILFENARLKVIALLVAVMLKVYFYSQNNSVISEFYLPVKIRNASSMMIVEPRNVEKNLLVRLKLEGPSPLVSQVQRESSAIIVDIGVDADTNFTYVFDYRRLGDQLRFPGGVQIKEIEPARVELRLEPVDRKELNVELRQVGDVEPGYEVSSVSVFPKVIRAQGPRSELVGVSNIATEMVNVAGLNESKRFEVNLQASDGLTTYDVNQVSVQVNISPIQGKKELKKLKVEVLAPEGFAATLTPSQVSIFVAGPISLLETLQGEQIEIVADATQLPAGKHALALQAKLPTGISLEKTVPEQVGVTLVSGKR